MKEYRIGVIAGDGIGPEVVAEGIKALECVSKLKGFSIQRIDYPYSGAHYLETGLLMDGSVLEGMRKLNAIFMGAVGHPEVPPGIIERSVIFTIRFGLDLYVNLRPVKLYAEHLCPLKDKKPNDVDMVVVRENTEDAYTGLGGFFKKGTTDEIATTQMIYTRKGVERVIRYAFELARKRGKLHKVTMVDKANAVPAHDLWRRTFAEVGEQYPDIERDVAFVDAACMWMVKNPEQFDVIVTTNLFGDIITDLGAIIQGGLGIAAGGNIHPGKVSMFEPIHGSAPKYAGRNMANPLATISAAAMMLDYLGEREAGALIERAIQELLVSRRVPSLDARSGLSTSQIGDMVEEEMSRQA